MSGGGEVQERQPESTEDSARANHYALIGRLFYDAPDSILIAELCGPEVASTEDRSALARAWRSLRDACSTAYPAVLKQEYDSLFVGVGKAQVTPYTSHYIRGISPDRHLVRLRQQLEQFGFGRRTTAVEVEDHVSGVCDVMRLLIEGTRPLAEQHLFFKEFVYPGAIAFCDSIEGAASASFYRHVAGYARAFLDVEREAFEMEDLDPHGTDENPSR